MQRRILMTLIALTCLAPMARAQFNVIGPGSTPAGDYLRGAGIEAVGLGLYNLNTARAESIHVNTYIRFDRYLGEVMMAGRKRYAEQNRRMMERLKAGYDKIQRRYSENPDQYNVLKGDALNKDLDFLNDPKIADSAYRLAPITISIEDIRRIPFHRADKNVVFSMERLSFQGIGKWPVALQDDYYAPERKHYEDVLDDALERMIEQKMPDSVIVRYEAAIQTLISKIDAKFGTANQTLQYKEAKDRLREMKKSAALLKITDLQLVMSELDTYHGKTIDDLRRFMQRHNLRFASAETASERKLYPDLHKWMMAVREVVLDETK